MELVSDKKDAATGSGLGPALLPWVFLLAFAATLATARNILNDQDPFWHVAAGNWIIAHRAVPHVDVFSFSMAGKPWVAHEWLSEVILAGVYDLLGWAGLVVLAALVFAASLTVLLALLLRYLPATAALLGTIGAFGLSIGHLHVRPHIFGLLLLVVWLGALVSAREKERAPSPAYAVVILLRANLHGGFILGLGLAALFAGEALFEANDRRAFMVAARGWSLLLALCVIATLATPNGVTGLLFAFHVMQMPYAMATINEWKSPDFQSLDAWDRRLASGSAARRFGWAASGILAAVGALALLHVGMTNANHRFAPNAAVQFAKDHQLTGHVFNDYEFGGYLIFSGIAPFVDGRADVYGDAFLQRAATAAELPALLQQDAIAWTLLDPQDARVALLDHLAGWQRAYADDIAVIHVPSESR